MNNQNQGYPAGGQNPFAYQAPPPNKNKKIIVLIVIAVFVAIATVAGILIWKAVSEQKEDEARRARREVKSKVTSANSASSSLYSAINTVLTEVDEEGYDTSAIEMISYSKDEKSVEITTSGKKTEIDEEDFYKSLKEYFNDVNEFDFKAACDGGICIAVASKQNSKYTGSKPVVVTKDNYKKYSDDLDKALEDAIEKGFD